MALSASKFLQGTLNLREWTMRHHVAGVDSAGVDNAGVVKTSWKSPTVCEIKSHVISTHSSQFRT